MNASRHVSILLYHVLLLIAVVFLAVRPANGLTDDEKTAIQAMIDSWPVLESVSPPWSSDRIELACNAPFKGLLCSSGHIFGLLLDGIPLNGTIPPEIGLLDRLMYLGLTGAKLVGSVPGALFRLEKLQQFRLSGNPLVSGNILPSMSNVTSLLDVELASTAVSGSVPNEIGNLVLLTNLDLSSTMISGTLPDSLGQLKSMVSFDISHSKIEGTLPSSMSEWEKLATFRASGSLLGGNLAAILNLTSLRTVEAEGARLSGTIPSTVSRLKMLTFDLARNSLSGSIPSLSASTILLNKNQLSGTLDGFAQTRADTIDVSYNRLSGSIAPNVIACRNFYAEFNQLSGSLPPDSLMSKELEILKLFSNQLNGTFPSELGPGVTDLLLSNNYFSGSLPASWASSYPHFNSLEVIDVSYNNLSGELPSFNHSTLTKLNLQGNNFEGQLPSFRLLESTVGPLVLFLSQNNFSGTVPEMPLDLNTFDAGGNQIEGGLSNLAALPKLALIDLSRNLLTGSVPTFLFQTSRSVSLAHNRLEGAFPFIKESPVATLDLSFNCLSGPLPLIKLPNLLLLRLANNSFTGGYHLITPGLVLLDLSSNFFSFPFVQLTNMPLISEIRISNNLIYGSFTDNLSQLASLRAIDVSSNSLDLPFDLVGLSHIIQQRQLTTVKVENNTNLPVVYNIPPEAQLRRAPTQRPSILAPHVVCYDLAFSGLEVEFVFDEWLFNWFQCDCAPNGFFGIPPADCRVCPKSFSCNGTDLDVSAHTFVYLSSAIGPPSPRIPSLPNAIQARNQDDDDFSIILSETCLKSVFDTTSSCKGLHASKEDYIYMTSNPKLFLASQCQPGSRGRLCSECICDLPSLSLSSDPNQTRECYFSRGNICMKCERIYDWRKTVPIAISLVLIGMLLLSVLMYWILESRRELKNSSWEELSIFRRALNRFTFALDLGFIPIIITYVQLMSQLTQWDSYVLRAYSQLLNGQTEAVGIRCLFPFVVAPLVRLLVQLFLPLVVILLVSCSIGIAEIMTRLKRKCAKKPIEIVHVNSDSDLASQFAPIDSQSADESEYDSSSQSMQVMLKKPHRTAYSREYPATALLSSVTISITQFFYFGTTLTSLEYFFFESQAVTLDHFVLSVPWMTFQSAASLRFASIAWAIGFVCGIPVAFGIICYKFKDKIAAPSFAIYFGTLFSRFKKPCFWWEIVNVFRKLIIAVILRTISPRSAIQSACVILVIGSVQVAQTTLQPWKMRLENIMDHLSSLLLVISLFVTHVAVFTRTTHALFLILALDCTFVISVIIVLIYLSSTSRTPYQHIWEARFGSRSATDRSTLLDAESEDPEKSTEKTSPSSSTSYQPLMQDAVPIYFNSVTQDSECEQHEEP